MLLDVLKDVCLALNTNALWSEPAGTSDSVSHHRVLRSLSGLSFIQCVV